MGLDGCTFSGIINSIGISDASGQWLYRAYYGDGDEEDFTQSQVKQYVTDDEIHVEHA